MKDTEQIAHRLALLEELSFSAADIESIAAESADLERIVTELEEFSQGTPWIAAQVQPADKKV